MSGETTAWSLYLDESGRQEDPHDDAVVAGVLQRDDVTAMARNPLLRAMWSLAPYLPWPFHRAHAWTTAHHAFAIERHVYWAPPHGDPALPSELVAAAELVLSALATVEPAATERLRRQYALGDDVDVEALQALDDVIPDEAGDAARVVVGYARQLDVGLRRVMKSIAAEAPAEPGPPVALFVAGESRRGAAAVDRRYLDLLHAVLERAGAVVARHPGRHRVEAVIARRDVPDASRASGRRPLRAEDIRMAELAAVCGGRVSFHPRLVPYDGTAHAGVVAADFAAGEARQVLRQRGTLAHQEDRLADLTGLPLLSGSPPWTHVASRTRAPLPPLAESARLP